MTQRIACKTCGASMLLDTAAKNDGLCMPCMGGDRTQIEDGRRHRERARLHEQSPERKYWVSLVGRVHHGPGFDALSTPEKTYFAVSCLIGEVYNGGFYQFFSSHSGQFYSYAIDGLAEFGATQSVELTIRAKALLFGSKSVPADWRSRNDLLPSLEALDVELDRIDGAFWQDPDELHERGSRFARAHGLY